MSRNRIEDYLPLRSSRTDLERDLAANPFALCPAVFLEGMTAEQFRAQQQLYQVAFERARATVERRASEIDDLGSGI